MKSLLTFLLLSATLLLGDELTGTWTGTLTRKQGDADHAGPAHLVLKQEGGKVTGTGGPNADEQHSISNGVFENGKITFQILDNGSEMKFALTVQGEEIKGDVTMERDGETRRGTLAVKRQK